jgi:hypothetical protein
MEAEVAQAGAGEEQRSQKRDLQNPRVAGRKRPRASEKRSSRRRRLWN